MPAQIKWFKRFTTERDLLEADVNAFLATLPVKTVVTVDAQDVVESAVQYIIVTVTYQ